MHTSEQIDKIAAAFAKAQAEIGTVKKDQKADAGKFGYTYASLANVCEAIAPALAKHGLAVTQAITQDPRQVTITTRLWHASGQWIENDCTVPVGSGGGAQAVGSAISYGRRYGLSALVGVATSDDDGAKAQEHAPKLRKEAPAKQQQPKAQPKPQQKRWTIAELIGQLREATEQKQLPVIGARLKALRLTAEQHDEATREYLAAQERIANPQPDQAAEPNHDYGPPAWDEPPPDESFGFGGAP